MFQTLEQLQISEMLLLVTGKLFPSEETGWIYFKTSTSIQKDSYGKQHSVLLSPDQIPQSWNSTDLFLWGRHNSSSSPFGTACFLWGKKSCHQLSPETLILLLGWSIAQSPPQQKQKQALSVHLSWWLQSFYSLYPVVVFLRAQEFL